MVAEVHLDRYLQSWEEKLAKFSKDVERWERSLEHTKYPDDVRKKLDTAQKNVESARRRIEDANLPEPCSGSPPSGLQQTGSVPG